MSFTLKTLFGYVRISYVFTRKCSSNERLRPVGGGGYSDISYIRRLGSILGAHNFEFYGSFQKKEYFWGMKILWKFYGVITKLDYI